jgi:hypothetical protein
MPLHSTLAFPIAVIAFAFASVAAAQNDTAPVYRCRQANGAVTYQDYACKGGVAVDIKPDAADPAAIDRLRRAQAEFDRSLAQRRAAEAMTMRPDLLEQPRIIVPGPAYDEDVGAPGASDVPGYLLYGPVAPANAVRRNRRVERRMLAPERRVVPAIRRLRPG